MSKFSLTITKNSAGSFWLSALLFMYFPSFLNGLAFCGPCEIAAFEVCHAPACFCQHTSGICTAATAAAIYCNGLVLRQCLQGNNHEIATAHVNKLCTRKMAFGIFGWSANVENRRAVVLGYKCFKSLDSKIGKSVIVNAS